MKKFSADMKVVRFGAEDVIVTSGAIMVFDEKMGDTIGGNGTVTFDGKDYLLSEPKPVTELRNAFYKKYGNNNPGIGDKGDKLFSLLTREVSSPTGLESGWVGSYTYDVDSNTFMRRQ